MAHVSALGVIYKITIRIYKAIASFFGGLALLERYIQDNKIKLV